MPSQRSTTGQVAYQAGASAEHRVAQDYRDRGYAVLAQRWRRGGGEIDLIVGDGETVIFVEVKKSGSFARAGERLSAAQMQRIYQTAEVFLGTQPSGALTPARFDVALLNQFGEVQIIENAFGQP